MATGVRIHADMALQAEMQYPNKNRGFSLLELLIVITVIAILIGVLLPNLNEARVKARDQKRKADVRALTQALETYKINQSLPSYPAAPLPNPGESWVVSSITYMAVMPTDPLYSTDQAKYQYRYWRNPADPLRYYVGACLEDPNDPDVKASAPGGTGWGGGCTRWYYVSEP